MKKIIAMLSLLSVFAPGCSPSESAPCELYEGEGLSARNENVIVIQSTDAETGRESSDTLFRQEMGDISGSRILFASPAPGFVYKELTLEKEGQGGDIYARFRVESDVGSVREEIQLESIHWVECMNSAGEILIVPTGEQEFESRNRTSIIKIHGTYNLKLFN